MRRGGASGEVLGGHLGAQNPPKSHPKRVQIEVDFQERKKSSSRASWSRLGAFLEHFGGHLGVQICAPVHAGVCGVKNHVFDVDQLSRRVSDPSWRILASKSAKNDPKMAPQNDPKSTKNGCQKMIKILIDFKRAIVGFWGWPGGLRWPLGGKTRGVRNAQDLCKFMFCDFFLNFLLHRPKEDKDHRE